MPRPPSDVRDKILDAAIKLLREQGERAVTQTRVAKEAGIPQGHLTYYFPKKSDLWLGVAERFAALNAETVMAYFAARQGEPRREVLLDYVKQTIADRQRTRMLLGLLVMSDSEPALAKIMKHHAGALRQMLGVALELPPTSPAVDLTLALLWGLGLHGFVLQEDRLAELLDQALAMMVPQPQPEP